jgi:hypothetical protein
LIPHFPCAADRIYSGVTNMSCKVLYSDIRGFHPPPPPTPKVDLASGPIGPELRSHTSEVGYFKSWEGGGYEGAREKIASQ